MNPRWTPRQVPSQVPSSDVQISHEPVHLFLLVCEWKKTAKFCNPFDLFFHEPQMAFEVERENLRKDSSYHQFPSVKDYRRMRYKSTVNYFAARRFRGRVVPWPWEHADDADGRKPFGIEGTWHRHRGIRLMMFRDRSRGSAPEFSRSKIGASTTQFRSVRNSRPSTPPNRQPCQDSETAAPGCPAP